MKLYKATIAIGLSSKCVILKGFPRNEAHEGLHELLEEMEQFDEFDNDAGVYQVELILHSDKESDTHYFEVVDYKEIYKLNYYTIKT
jgi:hypothetical protein